ncbi:hypothetical protein Tco_0796102 [Tanacetum coccineum]
MPEDPYAYVVAAFQAPPSLDYVPGPKGLKVLPAEERPLPAAVSPTVDSLGYVPESDPMEDLEEDDDEDPEEDPADYPTDGGDDSDDEDESSDDDEDDDETKPFKTDESAATPPPHPAYRVTARISIRDEPPTLFWSDTEIPSLPLPLILSPLHVSSPPPASPIRLLGYRASMIRLRAEAPSTSHSLPLPPPIHHMLNPMYQF